MKDRSFLFSKVLISLESFLTSKNQNPILILKDYLPFCIEQVFHQRLLFLLSDLRDAQFSGAVKGASVIPARPLGFTARPSVLSGRQRGAHKIILMEKDCPENDAVITRPMQENTVSKTLNFLGQRCPEDAGLCVPTYSSAPRQLLTQNNMQNAECTNSQNRHLH